MKLHIMKDPYNFIDNLWIEEKLNGRFSEKIKELIKNCLKVNPLERPNSKDIYAGLISLQLENSVNIINSVLRGNKIRKEFKLLNN
jgi:serine/threonine protein kinase